jgi:tetratricopeptide (TPR) repeat protein
MAAAFLFSLSAIRFRNMSALSELLNRAVTHHQAGRLAEAEALYREVLVIEPCHADSLHLLGLVAGETGNNQMAVFCIGRAIQYKPLEPLYYRNLGLALHRESKYEQAVVCYSKALELEPHHAETVVRMGRSLAARGLHEDAINLFRHAAGLAPEYAAAHLNLGLGLSRTGRFEEAAAAFREALRLEPFHSEAAFELGNSLQFGGRWTEAVSAYQLFLRHRPDDPETLYQLANTFHMLNRFEEAEEAYRRALCVRPDHADTCFNLAVTLTRLSRTEEAAGIYQKTLRLQPNCVQAHNNLANLRHAQGKLDEAIEGYKKALRLQPDYLDARYNLGSARQQQFRLDEAMEAYDAVLSQKPDHIEAQNNRGSTLLALGRPREALEGFEKALLHQPDHVEANFNRGLAHLLLGNLAEGWKGYEWRLRQLDAYRRDFAQPMWDGSPLPDQTLLVHAEQGLGDTIQFVRYLPMVRERCAHVFLECQPGIESLLGGYHTLDGVISRGSALPDFDYHVPLMSLPGIFGTTLESIPDRTPYLSVPPELASEWRRRIRTSRHRRIGLVWGGNARFKNEARRGMPLELWAPLAGVGGVSLYSLQRGPQARQLLSAPAGLQIVDLEQGQARISNTAAMMEALDLVITVDTMVAHLAGALQRPVWTLLSFAADWRWLLDRSDSPWYPGMRLFRQPREGDWESVVAQVMAALQ